MGSDMKRLGRGCARLCVEMIWIMVVKEMDEGVLISGNAAQVLMWEMVLN